MLSGMKSYTKTYNTQMLAGQEDHMAGQGVLQWREEGSKLWELVCLGFKIFGFVGLGLRV